MRSWLQWTQEKWTGRCNDPGVFKPMCSAGHCLTSGRTLLMFFRPGKEAVLFCGSVMGWVLGAVCCEQKGAFVAFPD